MAAAVANRSAPCHRTTAGPRAATCCATAALRAAVPPSSATRAGFSRSISAAAEVDNAPLPLNSSGTPRCPAAAEPATASGKVAPVARSSVLFAGSGSGQPVSAIAAAVPYRSDPDTRLTPRPVAPAAFGPIVETAASGVARASTATAVRNRYRRIATMRERGPIIERRLIGAPSLVAGLRVVTSVPILPADCGLQRAVIHGGELHAPDAALRHDCCGVAGVDGEVADPPVPVAA